MKVNARIFLRLNVICEISQVQQEIFDVEKNLELMRKAIADKSYATKVAHTRIEARMHRPDMELCRDYAYARYVLCLDNMAS